VTIWRVEVAQSRKLSPRAQPQRS